jgi:geranylgeranyl transferase type-2 subunit alpha
VLQLTSKLLSQNPEHYTIWNVRRRLLVNGLFSKASDPPSRLNLSSGISLTSTSNSESSNLTNSTLAQEQAADQKSPNPPSSGKNDSTLELINNDLDFLVPLLRQYPKCYWIWNYRIWLLQQANARLEVGVARRLWQEDLGLVTMMLVKDNRNFHGWNYRRIVVTQLESSTLKGSSMVESEFSYTTNMICISLSNFSAWHNRSKLIPRLLSERMADDTTRRKFLDDGMASPCDTFIPHINHCIIEFEIMTNALWTDSKDQSLWFYYQFLMTAVINQTDDKSIVPGLSREERVDIIRRQLDELKEMLDDAEEPKWIYVALLQYSVALYGMEERHPTINESRQLGEILVKLHAIDPMRSGRWTDLENSLSLQS